LLNKIISYQIFIEYIICKSNHRCNVPFN